MALWISFNVPGRPCAGTYSATPLAAAPPVAAENKFRAAATLQDVRRLQEEGELDFESPTACYFDVDEESGNFFYDQQGCVVWRLHSDGKVYWNADEEFKPEFCVGSLGDFLWRMDVESRLWFWAHASGKQQIAQDRQNLSEGRPLEPLDAAVSEMAEYARHYLQLEWQTLRQVQSYCERPSSWFNNLYNIQTIDTANLWRNVAIWPNASSYAAVVAFDHLFPQLDVKFIIFGGLRMGDDVLPRVQEQAALLERRRSEGLLAWMCVAKRLKLTKNVAELIGRQVDGYEHWKRDE